MCRGSEEGGRGISEMVRLVKRLPCKHEELSLIPQNLYKSSQAQWHP